jgi:hypothetical protein
VVRFFSVIFRVVRHCPVDEDHPRRYVADTITGRLVHHWIGGRHGDRPIVHRLAVRSDRPETVLYLTVNCRLVAGDNEIGPGFIF